LIYRVLGKNFNTLQAKNSFGPPWCSNFCLGRPKEFFVWSVLKFFGHLVIFSGFFRVCYTEWPGKMGMLGIKNSHGPPVIWIFVLRDQMNFLLRAVPFFVLPYPHSIIKPFQFNKITFLNYPRKHLKIYYLPIQIKTPHS
jgi:hypothetical protein